MVGAATYLATSDRFVDEFDAMTGALYKLRVITFGLSERNNKVATYVRTLASSVALFRI